MVVLLVAPSPVAARTRKGDRFLNQGRDAQLAEEWDKALALYEQALAEDPSDTAYQMAVRRLRFQTSQYHVRLGQQMLAAGKLDEALQEFQRAYAVDPSSAIAEQELLRTFRLIREREQKGAKDEPEAKVLTPDQEAAQEREKRLDRLLGLRKIHL